MKLNVFFTPDQKDELCFSNRIVVVIDVLRASNTIITALSNGAKEIIPVSSIDAAARISRNLFGASTILGGEKNTKKIEGFTLGNSPREYTEDNVKSKSVVFFTTNGSKAVLKAKYAEKLFICSFINLNAVAKRLDVLSLDVDIICSGNSGGYSMEDVVCAGMLVNQLSGKNNEVTLTDSAKAAVVLHNSFSKDIFKMLLETEHGRILVDNGFEEDIAFCSRLNTSSAVPYLSGNVIKLFSDS